MALELVFPFLSLTKARHPLHLTMPPLSLQKLKEGNLFLIFKLQQ